MNLYSYSLLQRRCPLPEGPELKISCELIRPLVKGKYLVNAGFYDNGRYSLSKEIPKKYTSLLNAAYAEDILIEDVNVKGKFMYWTFSNNWYMFCTYGMSGQWSPQQGKHPCMWLNYMAQSPKANAQALSVPNGPPALETIYFNDPRHFGTIRISDSVVDLTEKLVSLGWDPFTGFSSRDKIFIDYKIKNSSKPLAQLLMDQSIFAGVGNYIKSEALYLAKLSPHRTGNSLSDSEIYELCQSIMSVMESSYQHQGATLSTFKTPYGDEGKYSTLFKVYGCKIDPLGNKVIKETLADKRTTHWVPQIQR